MTSSSSSKEYDIILFGITGFTGKLALEYMHKNYYGQQGCDNDVKWAVSARNETKAQQVLREICCTGSNTTDTDTDDDARQRQQQQRQPPLLAADLTGPLEELAAVVKKTSVVITCSGPFEKYGHNLVKLCAENGVHYADITGETDFVRDVIARHDAAARNRKGGDAAAAAALIVPHCGNDCIPQDLTVFEMHRYARSKGYELREVRTYAEFSQGASMSGGTVATAHHHLSKDRSAARTTDFDPLLTNESGVKSENATKNISPKGSTQADGVGTVEPWIMGPVMVNCVRRSNALLGYSNELRYGDARVSSTSVTSWLAEKANAAVFAGALAVPSVFGHFLPNPGEGPNRETMENGYLILHGRGSMIKKNNNKNADESEASSAGKDTTRDDDDAMIKLESKLTFNKDIAYLYTAALLVECGMLLLDKVKSSTKVEGGVVTPAVAFGGDLTNRIVDKLDATWELKEA